MRLSDIARNDVSAAVRYYEQQLDAAGDIDPDEAHVLIRLQDDPQALFAAVDELVAQRKAKGLAVGSLG